MAANRRRARGEIPEEIAAPNAIAHSPPNANILGNSPPAYAQAVPLALPNANVAGQQQNNDMANIMNRMIEMQNNTMQMMQQNNNAVVNAINDLQRAVVPLRQPAPVNIRQAANNANAQRAQGNQQDANAAQNAPNQPARTHHLKTSDVKIPTFSGANDTKTPYDYILELEKYQTIVGYSEVDMINHVIPLSLTGDAYNWYRYEPPFRNWGDYRARLRNEFQAIGYKEDLKRELDMRYQGTNESLTSFIRIIYDYYRRIGDDTEEQVVVSQIKRLMHPEYRKALIGIPTNTLDELKAAAPQAQELIKSYRSYRLPPTHGSLEPSLAWKPLLKSEQGDAVSPVNTKSHATMPIDIPKSPPKLHYASVDPYSYYHSAPRKAVKFQSPIPSPTKDGRNSSRESSPSRNDRRCYNCQAVGHMANQCPKPKKNAGSISPKQNEMLCNDEMLEMATVSLCNKDKRPFINVQLLGQNFPAFLDTGSSISVLGDDVLPLIHEKGIKCKVSQKAVRFLKGNCQAEKSVTLTVDFEMGSRRHTFFVMPSTIKTILLGRDFLIPAKISVHVGEGGWSVGPTKDNILPFINYPSPFLINEANYHSETISYEKDKVEIPETNLFEDEALVVDQIDYPAQLLTTWEYTEENEVPRQASIPESALIPGTIYEAISAPSTLTSQQRKRLREILIPFLPMFTLLPGLCAEYEHVIDTGDSKPISTHLRPMSPGKRKVFEESFQELLDNDIIEPSNSPWSANAFVVPKPNGGLRPVIDYKPINKVTIPDVYPIPRIDDILALLGGCSYFSVFDLAKGYFQIQMRHEDKPKTAFICHNGLWQYKRMPMGLRNAPSTFQRCVDKILGPYKGQFCAVYFDDICVFSKSFEEHINHIALVLEKLRNAGFTIHPNKVQLCRTTFKYLGFVIQPGKCLPDEEKVKCLKQYPRPSSPKDIQKFLGFVGFYRRFVPDFAKHSKPLTSLLKKGIKFEWNANAELGFTALKNSLSEYTLLYLPDMTKEFIIQTDASDFAIGAILLQEVDEVRHPVWFASRTLRPAEINYSTFQKEILAVLWAIEKFKGFVEYSHFTLETDHQAISWLNRIKDPTGRLARWFMQLQMFDFTVHYRKGTSKIMQGPDALSRIHHIMLTESDMTISRDEFVQAQDNDAWLMSIKEFMLNGKESLSFSKESLTREASYCSLTDDKMLMKYVGCKGKPWEDERQHWRVYVPKSMQNRVIAAFHSDELSCHLGIRKTFGKLEQRVYWKNLRKDVQNYINRCMVCQQSKASRLPPVPATGFKAESPWDFITVDIMGPYTKGSLQSTHILLVVDYYTRYVEIFPLRSTTAEVVVSKLWQVCMRWGIPRCILSDNGTQFTSKLYADWCKSLSIRPFYISAYHPQANLTERYCQTVKSMIVSTITKCKAWDKHLPELAFAMHSSISDATGFTPAYANLGRELRTPFDNAMQIQLSSFKDVKDLGKRLSVVHTIIKDELEVSQNRHLKYYNKKAKARSYKKGDLVWLKTHYLSDASRGITSSLLKKREGPYQVIKVITEHVYDLECVGTGARVNKVHINELSPCLLPSSNNGGSNQEPTSQEIPKEVETASTSILLPNADVSSRHVTLGNESTSQPKATDPRGPC